MTSSIRYKITRLLVVASFVAAASCVLLVQSSSVQTEPAAKTSTRLPSLFDFAAFQRHFGKVYSSHLEAVTRKVYYLANAFKVYVAGLAYRSRRLGHYLAVNHMSDWSPRERDMMVNKKLAGDHSHRDVPAEPAADVTQHEEGDMQELAAKLEMSIQEKLAENHIEHEFDDEPKHKAKRLRRHKRDADKLRRRGPRHLDMDMLVQGSDSHPDGVRVSAEEVRRPPTNNPLYDPLAIVGWSRGLRDQQESLTYWMFKDEIEMGAKRDSVRRFGWPSLAERVAGLKNYLKGTLTSYLHETDPDDQVADNQVLEDVMFQDLNESGCMFPPRQQLRCGCCYAFAAISMAEFLYCKKTGRLYAFSEQYMVDCGKGRLGEMDGCDGSPVKDTAAFIHNFGLELRDKYPYVARELTCPYSDDTDLKTTGYIRMPLENILYVSVKRWSEALKKSPILMTTATPPDFDQYGGGVHSGAKCGPKATHAMLVVGEGREDGQEFWLIRNSHGTHWGEKGHWKLAKSAPETCITNQRGYLWATNDAESFQLDPTFNGENPQVIKDYLEHLASMNSLD